MSLQNTKTRVTETSREAYLKIPMTPQHKKIFEFFKKWYPLRFSDQDLKERFGWTINVITARRNALMNSGYIRHVGFKKNTKTGFKNRVYQYCNGGNK